MAAATGAFGYNSSANTELFYTLPPIQITSGAGTYIYPIPKGCIAYTLEGVGAGGSGGVARYQGKTTGGSGGAWGKIFRTATSGATSITAILGAGGVGVTIAASGATIGNDGSSTTVSDGAITLTLPPGKAGSASQSLTTAASATVGSVPTVNDGRFILTCLGSTSGAVAGTSGTGGSATGGGACGNPDGRVRANSGAVGASVLDGEINRATGGASINAGSGDCISTGACSTGGAGVFASVASTTAGAKIGGGSKASGLSFFNGQTTLSSLIINDLLYDQGYGLGGEIWSSYNDPSPPQGAGSGGGLKGGVTSVGANGSHKGGTGGMFETGAVGSPAGTGVGGIFAASGAVSSNVTAASVKTSGAGGFGCGSGGVAEHTNLGTCTSGSGGDAFVRIQFFIRKP